MHSWLMVLVQLVAAAVVLGQCFPPTAVRPLYQHGIWTLVQNPKKKGGFGRSFVAARLPFRT